MPTLLEGVAAAAQPCSYPLLVIGLVLVIAAGPRRGWAAAGFTVGAAVLAWVRFARLWSADLAGPTAVLAGLALVLAALAVSMRFGDDGTARRGGAGLPAAALVAAAVGGAVAALAWKPCVGARLAAIINGAPVDRLDALGPTAAYLIGLSLPVLALAALAVAVPALGRCLDRAMVTRGSVISAIVLASLMAIGLWDNVVAELLARSTT